MSVITNYVLKLQNELRTRTYNVISSVPLQPYNTYVKRCKQLTEFYRAKEEALRLAELLCEVALKDSTVCALLESDDSDTTLNHYISDILSEVGKSIIKKSA